MCPPTQPGDAMATMQRRKRRWWDSKKGLMKEGRWVVFGEGESAVLVVSWIVFLVVV